MKRIDFNYGWTFCKEGYEGNLYDESNENLTLLALGSHKNFYRDLKR